MKPLAIIGSPHPDISYTDRPTIKVIIKKDDRILLLNQGLLPGGGIDQGESGIDAIARELNEELGVAVGDIEQLGTVIQYRDYLRKKYLVHGYTASLLSEGATTNPQDDGEASFTQQWVTIEEAKTLVESSIKALKLNPQTNDTYQGRLYNLMTTLELLKALPL